MAGIENGRKPYAWLQRVDHDAVHFIINDVTSLSEIHRVDDFVVAIILVAVFVGSLTAVA